MTWIRSFGLRLILAFLLSFALWVFVSYTQNPDRHVRFDNVPVETVDLSPGLVLVDNNGLPRTARPTVSITIEGASDDLQNVSERDLRAYQDLSGLGQGQHIPDVRVESIRSDLVRLRFTPDPQRLPVRLEQEITRTVALTVTVTGLVPFSFQAGSPSVTIRNQAVVSATVRGPQNRVERVLQVRASADIDRLTSTYDSPRTLDAIAEDGQVVDGVTITPAQVNLRVPIEPTVGLKRVPVVPAIDGTPATGFVVMGVTVDPPLVELTGSALDAVERVTTSSVNVGGATRPFTRTVTIIEPPGARLRLANQVTAVVTVQVGVLNQLSRITLPLPIRVIEVSDGLQVAITPSVAQFTFQGLPVALAQFDPNNLAGLVVAKGLGPGTYSIVPELSSPLPQGVQLVGPVPKITLSLIPPPTATPTPTESPTLVTIPETETAIIPTATVPITGSTALPTAIPNSVP